MKINSVHLVTMCQMESKKKKKKKKKKFSLSDNINRKIAFLEVQLLLLFLLLSSFSVYLSIYLSIYLSTHAPICKALFEYQKPAALLSTFNCCGLSANLYIGMKVPSTSSLSVYTKVLVHNLNDIRNWASLIGLLFSICWCLLSIFLIYCSGEWEKLVNLIYCFQVLFRMNFKIMNFLMNILGNTPSADSTASQDSLSSQNAT